MNHPQKSAALEGTDRANDRQREAAHGGADERGAAAAQGQREKGQLLAHHIDGDLCWRSTISAFMSLAEERRRPFASML